MHTILHKFAKSRKKHGLELVGKGGSLDLSGKIASFFIALETNRFITLEETRVLLVENIEALLEMINSDKDHSEYYESLPFPRNKIKVSIYGNKEHGSSYIYIASSLDNKLYYLITNPDPSNYDLIEILEETFEEAKKIVSIQKMKKLSSNY